ncbi:MAG: type II toxin-antitoxin system VapC family toxin [Dehalococcoidia bacterium]
MIAILDTGPLFAALDKRDRNHQRCTEVLDRLDLDFVVPTLVVTEVTYFAGRYLGANVEADFLRGLAGLELDTPIDEEWSVIAQLVERHGDFPLGAVDASIVALAERLDTDLIVTLDRRHFGALRMQDGRPFRILPE